MISARDRLRHSTVPEQGRIVNGNQYTVSDDGTRPGAEVYELLRIYYYPELRTESDTGQRVIRLITEDGDPALVWVRSQSDPTDHWQERRSSLSDRKYRLPQAPPRGRSNILRKARRSA